MWIRKLVSVTALVLTALSGVVTAQQGEPSTIAKLAAEAVQLRSLISTPPAVRFLDVVPELPALETPRIVYYNRGNRDALTEAAAAGKDSTALAGYERTEIGEQFFYYTRYGTPLAFVRPLEILGQADLEGLAGKHIADFGFGSIGHLRAMASAGADVTGIEVDALLEALYSEPGDTGPIKRARAAPTGEAGYLRLCFGRFPTEAAIVEAVGDGYHVFVSKNTLKNGYIHPAEEVDPRMLVHLGVDDETYVRAIYNLLVPGGYFLIYNLCPAQSEEKYIPWADGRSPFASELLESVGFTVLAYNRNDDAAAREMGRALGWDAEMDLENDLFGVYTLVRK
jgi:hypothetical protein